MSGTINYRNQYFSVPGLPEPIQDFHVDGRTCDYHMMPYGLNGYGEGLKDLGANKAIGNNGFDHPPSEQSHAGAQERASAHSMEPYFWVKRGS